MFTSFFDNFRLLWMYILKTSCITQFAVSGLFISGVVNGSCVFGLMSVCQLIWMRFNPSGNLPLSLVKRTNTEVTKTEIHRLATRGWLQNGVSPINPPASLMQHKSSDLMYSCGLRSCDWCAMRLVSCFISIYPSNTIVARIQLSAT